MKNKRSKLIQPLLSCVAWLVAVAAMAQTPREMENGFRSPPPAARPWVYYFPSNGNLTKEGITADLEAMARVGIGGLLYMEVAQGVPNGQADFAGPLWRELVQHACKEARRFGLEINMNNDAGWCGSGGPWITPELSMQEIVWSEAIVEGGKKFEGTLAKPRSQRNYYKDIAVLAMPAPLGDDVTLADLNATLTSSGTMQKPNDFKLPKPSANQPAFVQIEFAAPFTARTLTASFRGVYHTVKGELQASEDGRTFKTVQSFTAQPPSLTLNFDPVTARFFRLALTGLANPNLETVDVFNVNLSARYRLNGISGKACFTPEKVPPLSAIFPSLPAELAIARDKTVDITAHMDAAGKLTWDAPPGKWLVLRFGHTTNGTSNHPAPAAGLGLECDKLSKEAAAAHYRGLMGMVVGDNQSLAGQGKALVSTHIDSWEIGSQNWTPKMREEFQSRFGYDLLKFLPVFTGRIVESVEVTERFLWDLRLALSDLLAENYAGELRRLANKDGLRLSIEAYGRLAADDLKYGGQADEPMAEFWAWPNKFQGGGYCAEMASAAHIYGKRIIAAEAFTSLPSEKWLGHPAAIKDMGDAAFCEGINRLVFHRFTAQPWTNVAPGMCMGPYGLHYERTQTWWEQSKPWHEYLARCQYLLRQGNFVADVLHLQPEGVPAGFTAPPDTPAGPLLRDGYKFDGCTTEVLLTRLSVKEGRLVLPDGMSYRMLVLPPVETMTPPVLRKIKELVDAGATIIAGTKPPKISPSLADMGDGDATVKQLTGELWPRLVTGKTAAEVLAARGVPPDFSAKPKLRFCHRSISGTEIYFVANPEPRRVDAIAAFRITGKQPELWWPESGRIKSAIAFEGQGGVTRVPLSLEPCGSLFVVFRQPSDTAKQTVSMTQDGRELLPQLSGTGVIGQTQDALPAIDFASGDIFQSGTYVFKTAGGQQLEQKVALPAPQEITGPWQVEFDPRWGGPGVVKFEKLDDWSKRSEPGIKYYSGTATYRKVFNWQPSAGGQRWYLDLGKVAIMAAVTLNGESLGTCWKAPYRVDVTGVLHPGENRLELKIVNLWVNRMIGDEQLPSDCDRHVGGGPYRDGQLKEKTWPQWLQEGKPSPSGRYTFATHPLWKKDDPLVESGLLGPVALTPAVQAKSTMPDRGGTAEGD